MNKKTRFEKKIERDVRKSCKYLLRLRKKLNNLLETLLYYDAVCDGNNESVSEPRAVLEDLLHVIDTELEPEGKQ